MGLDTYRQKRRFDRTPEPAGRLGRTAGALQFVVQKHAARRLHYDFRLELNGVLLSWAVPKGPSYDPGEKRLAVHVEDHPLEYGDFEGVIPQREYGGGTVVLWDRGVWVPKGDPSEQYEKGRLKFELAGEKLIGGWTLVRMGRQNAGEKENWLLIKERDGTERSPTEADIVETRPESVATGRTLEEIASQKDRVWRSKETVTVIPKGLPAAKKARLPAKTAVKAQLATLVDAVPEGDDWLHEIKFDGYRLLCRLEKGEAALVTRNGKDWTERFAPLARAATSLAANAALLDGEAVALNDSGRSDFQLLQNALGGGASPLVYYAFDLLHLEGHDLRSVGLLERKQLLRELLERSGVAGGTLRYSDHVVGNGPAFFGQACELQLEGVISKRTDAPYIEARSRTWLKTKCTREQEFVIVGYTDPKGSRTGFGALAVGYHDAEGELRYAGKVGTGYDEATLKALLRRLKKLEREEAPVVNPPRGGEARGLHWVEPTLVAQVAFTEWTQDDILRHPVFKGLREDKAPSEVIREARTPHRRAEQQAAAESNSPPAPGQQAGPEVSPEELTALLKDLPAIRLTNPQRVLFPADGITKQDLAGYYALVARWMLPLVRDRALTLVRCPEGIDGPCFYQKHVGEAVPKSIKRVPVEEARKTGIYLYVDSVEALVSLVQIGVLEIHFWGSRIDKIEKPDLLVLDLDPDPAVSWSRVVEAALELRDRLAELGLQSFAKTTGGKGLHVVVPLTRRTDWEDAKEFARALAEERVRLHPRSYTAAVSKAKRKGKIYIDYLRNARGSTAIAPYSTRARPGAPVATPIAWDELSTQLDPGALTVRTLPSRLLSLRRDPWSEYATVRQSITAAARKAVGM
ncbi:MAG: DNA ligase D [Longimicrobiales bacterium]